MTITGRSTFGHRFLGRNHGSKTVEIYRSELWCRYCSQAIHCIGVKSEILTMRFSLFVHQARDIVKLLLVTRNPVVIIFLSRRRICHPHCVVSIPKTLSNDAARYLAKISDSKPECLGSIQCLGSFEWLQVGMHFGPGLSRGAHYALRHFVKRILEQSRLFPCQNLFNLHQYTKTNTNNYGK
jgi:hypothetical protein